MFETDLGLQWLPAEFHLSEDGTHCGINSYINSLHPKQHAGLYRVIADCFVAVAPLLEEALTNIPPRPTRIDVPSEKWEDHPSESEGEDEAEDHPSESEGEDEYVVCWRKRRTVIELLPPAHFVPPPPPPRVVSLKGRFLQVITKIASIELTPDKPKYDGGSWHVEGMVGERIVATCCVYIDSVNISETNLSFLTSIGENDGMYDKDEESSGAPFRKFPGCLIYIECSAPVL